MKSLLFCAAGLAALAAAPAMAGDAGYEMWRSTKDGRTVVAVAREGEDGAYGVAAGKTGALDVLKGAAAEKAMKELRAQSGAVDGERLVIADAEAHGDHVVWIEKKDEEKSEKDGKQIKRVVVKKSGDGDVKKEVHRVIITDGGDDEDVLIERVEKKAGRGEHGDHDVKEVKTKKVIVLDGDVDIDADIDFEALDDAGGMRKLIVETDDGEKGGQRFLRIAGADADDAADFIDDMDGLDASEKAALKSAVGL